MIYLIMKMFVYLAVALLAGFGAGWLMRNLMAGKKEEEMQRTLSETKSRLPQFESLMRSRDEQMKTLRQELKDKDARIGELHEEMGMQDKVFWATKLNVAGRGGGKADPEKAWAQVERSLQRIGREGGLAREQAVECCPQGVDV